MVFDTSDRPLDAATLLAALRALAKGDFGARLPSGLTGGSAEIAAAFNELAARNEAMVEEIERVSHRVGREGRIKERARLGDVEGAWAHVVEAVNRLLDDIVLPTVEVSRVIGAAV